VPGPRSSPTQMLLVHDPPHAHAVVQIYLCTWPGSDSYAPIAALDSTQNAPTNDGSIKPSGRPCDDISVVGLGRRRPCGGSSSPTPRAAAGDTRGRCAGRSTSTACASAPRDPSAVLNGPAHGTASQARPATHPIRARSWLDRQQSRRSAADCHRLWCTTRDRLGHADRAIAAVTPPTRRFDLTDGQWAVLAALLPQPKRSGRPSLWSRRQLIDGIRWRIRVGAPWRDVPMEYGSWQAVYALFRRWQRDGTWSRMLTALQALADARGEITWDVSVDSTTARAHQHAAGARKRGICKPNRPVVSPSSLLITPWVGPVAD